MKRIAIVIAMIAAIISAILCWRVLGFIPHVPDELSYLYQGRILSTGHLSVPAPDVPEAFVVKWDHILRNSGRWRALYPPGWPLLLAIGWWIHAPWIINPVLLCFSTIGLFHLAAHLFDEKTALYSVFAFVASPFVLLMSAGFMAHSAALCFSVWCTFYLARGQGKDFFKAGALGAVAFMIRPYTAFTLLLPAFVWFWWNSEDRKIAAVHIALGSVPSILFFGVYNHLLFGSIFTAGYSYDPDASFRGSLFGYFKEHIPWYFRALNRNLWSWPWPNLLIFVPLLLPRKKWKVELLLAFCFLSLLTAYSVYYYADIVYAGPRYIYEAMGFVAILAARSLQRFGEKVAPFLLLLFLYPLVGSLPAQIDYHKTAYHGQSKELLDLVTTQGVGKDALVLISGDPNVFRTFYLENSLDPAKSRRVFARDIPGLRGSLLKAYPRKEVWSMNIELKMLTGPNFYEDRAVIRSIKWERLL